MAAILADDALKNKRNTEAIEVAPNTLGSARVIEHQPAQQPALVATSLAVLAVLRAEGIEPDYVVGHSVGEYVAACLALVLAGR